MNSLTRKDLDGTQEKFSKITEEHTEEKQVLSLEINNNNNHQNKLQSNKNPVESLSNRWIKDRTDSDPADKRRHPDNPARTWIKQ